MTLIAASPAKLKVGAECKIEPALTGNVGEVTYALADATGVALVGDVLTSMADALTARGLAFDTTTGAITGTPLHVKADGAELGALGGIYIKATDAAGTADECSVMSTELTLPAVEKGDAPTPVFTEKTLTATYDYQKATIGEYFSGDALTDDNGVAWVWSDPATAATAAIPDGNSTTYKVKFEGNDDYAATTEDQAVTVTIAKADVVLTLADASIKYGETYTPVATAKVGGSETATEDPAVTGQIAYNYKAATAEGSAYSTTQPTDAGEYTVKASFAGDGNYNAATDTTATLTIGKKGAADVTPPTDKPIQPGESTENPSTGGEDDGIKNDTTNKYDLTMTIDPYVAAYRYEYRYAATADAMPSAAWTPLTSTDLTVAQDGKTATFVISSDAPKIFWEYRVAKGGPATDGNGSPLYPNGNPVIDPDGNLLDPDGEVIGKNPPYHYDPDKGGIVDKDGDLVDKNGDKVTIPEGGTVDEDGNVVDKDGSIVDQNGKPVIDQNGNLLGPDGNQVTPQNPPYTVDDDGHIKDGDGNIIGNDRTPIIDAEGNLLDIDGKPVVNSKGEVIGAQPVQSLGAWGLSSKGELVYTTDSKPMVDNDGYLIDTASAKVKHPGTENAIRIANSKADAGTVEVPGVVQPGGNDPITSNSLSYSTEMDKQYILTHTDFVVEYTYAPEDTEHTTPLSSNLDAAAWTDGTGGMVVFTKYWNGTALVALESGAAYKLQVRCKGTDNAEPSLPGTPSEPTQTKPTYGFGVDRKGTPDGLVVYDAKTGVGKMISAKVGYTSVETAYFTLSNTGTGEIKNISFDAKGTDNAKFTYSFESVDDAVVVSQDGKTVTALPGGKSVTLKVTPIAALAAGEYKTTIYVYGTGETLNDVTTNFFVRFAVEKYAGKVVPNTTEIKLGAADKSKALDLSATAFQLDADGNVTTTEAGAVQYKLKDTPSKTYSWVENVMTGELVVITRTGTEDSYTYTFATKSEFTAPVSDVIVAYTEEDAANLAADGVEISVAAKKANPMLPGEGEEVPSTPGEPTGPDSEQKYTHTITIGAYDATKTYEYKFRDADVPDAAWSEWVKLAAGDLVVDSNRATFSIVTEHATIEHAVRMGTAPVTPDGGSTSGTPDEGGLYTTTFTVQPYDPTLTYQYRAWDKGDGNAVTVYPGAAEEGWTDLAPTKVEIDTTAKATFTFTTEYKNVGYEVRTVINDKGPSISEDTSVSPSKFYIQYVKPNTAYEYRLAQSTNPWTPATSDEFGRIEIPDEGPYEYRVPGDENTHPGDSGTVTKGVEVTGEVTSYGERATTTIILWVGNIEDGTKSIKVSEIPESSIKYTVQIAAVKDGQTVVITQNFAFDAVAAGTYNMTIYKDAHTTYTKKNLVIGDAPVDLAALLSKTPVLNCGDVNGDNEVTALDLNALKSSDNYFKKVENADNKLTDLNNDGEISALDLNLLKSAEYYMKSGILVD